MGWCVNVKEEIMSDRKRERESTRELDDGERRICVGKWR